MIQFLRIKAGARCDDCILDLCGYGMNGEATMRNWEVGAIYQNRVTGSVGLGDMF